MKQAPLEILLLGPIEIKFDEELITINRRIERALLYILALEHKPVSRTKLIDLLWPDANQSDPRASLRTALSRLRNDLPDPDIIHTDLDLVWLDFERCFVDVEEFKQQYQQLLHLLTAYQNNRTLPVSIVNRINKALDLWRGNKICCGDNLSKYPAIDIWRQSINNKLNHRRKYLMKRLAEHYQISGQLEKALPTFMKLSRIDTSDVANQCAALDILISMGRHQDAMNYCDTLENIYESDFNSPLPDEILSRCQHALYKSNLKQGNEDKQWQIPLTMNLPLIGRQIELYQLHKAYSQGGWVAVQGAMGIGKTRLVKELFETLSPKPLLLTASCKEMESSLPFSPIIHCLRNYMPADIWEEINPVWVNQLTLLLPELTRYLDENKQTPISKLPAGKQHLFDALLNLFKYISHKYGRILFFLDNAQWLDSQSLQAISYFIMQDFLEKHRLLVIASRPEENNPELDNMINHSFQWKPNQVINLSGLDFFELNNLTMQVLDEPPSEIFIDKLMKETSGNPFLALEIIRHILETKYYPDKFGEASTLPLPTNIQLVLRKRLLALNEESRHLLLCVAVLGDNLTLNLLETVVDLTPSAMSKSIDSLLKSGFLQSTSGFTNNENNLHFSNELMREVVLKEASEVQLQILNRQIAQRMASNDQYEDKAGSIAHYFLLGGETKKAFYWLLKAANHAWVLGSEVDAQKSYKQAEKLMMSGSNGLFTNSDIIKLYRQWSGFAYESHQVELVEQIGAKLEYIGNRENHPLLLGTSQIIFSDACFLRSDFYTGLDLIQEGIENLEIAGEQEALIKAVNRKGVISWWTMDFDQVKISANRVLELCQKSTLKDDFKIPMEFNAKHLINMLDYVHGQASQALKAAHTLHKTYYHKLDTFNRLRSLYLISYNSMIAAEYDQCEIYTQKALEIARPLGNSLIEEFLLIILGKVEFIQGKFEQSYQHLTQTLKSSESTNRKHNIIFANCVLGDMFRVLGNHTNALQHYRVGQIREGFSSISFFGIENNIHLAHYLSSINQKEETQKILQQYLPITKELDLGALYIQGLMASGVLNMSKGDLASTKKYFKRAVEIAEERGLFYEFALAKLAYAKVLLLENKSVEALAQLDKVLEISQERKMILVYLYALSQSAFIYKENNDLVKVLKNRLAFIEIIENIRKEIKSEPMKELFFQASENWKNNFSIRPIYLSTIW